MSAGVNAWKCGRCETWNKIEDEKCKKCGADFEQWHTAVRYHNALTPEEERFYHGTAVQMLRELRTIRNLLERLVGGSDDDSFKHERS